MCKKYVKYLILCAFLLTGCSTTLPNGCLVEAVSYKYSLIANSKLNSGKILIVEYDKGITSHAYFCFSTNGKDLHCYDAYLGSIDVLNARGPLTIAQYVTSLSNALYDQNLTVVNAYFLEE
jgi:hypothetical protein